MRRFWITAVAVLLVVGGVWGLSADVSQPAAPQVALAGKAGCYGDWCSGKDPQTSGCGLDGRTASATSIELAAVVAGTDQRFWKKVATLELRWSPTCKTNWARLSVVDKNGISKLHVTQDTGYEQSKGTTGWYGDTYAGVFYTPMIYSPYARCRAWVSGGSFKVASTGWV